MLHATIDGLWWNEHITHDMNDAIRCDSILNRDSRKGVDFNFDKTAIPGDINAERLIFQ